VWGFASNPERENQEREFLVKGLTFYEQLANTNATDWAARRARASACTNVGLLQHELKNHVESEKAFHQAVRLLEELADERPADFDNRFDLATTCMWSCRPYRDSGRIEPAEEITRHALALYDKLVADFPDQRPRIQEGICDCQRTLADLLKRTSRAQEAEEALRQSLATCTELAAANPKHAPYRCNLALNLGDLGDLYDQTGRSSKASAAWEEARSLFEKLASEIPGEAGYQDQAAHLDWRLAGLLKRTSKPKEAEESYRRALRVFEKLAADYPAAPFYRQEVAHNYWLLGGLLKETGQVQEAERAYRQALLIHEKLVADFPKSGEYRARLGVNYEILGGFLRGRARAEEAVESYRAARDVWEKLVADFPGNAAYYNNFAWRLATSPDSDLRDPSRAVALARRAIELAPEQPMFWNTLGVARYRAGDWRAAIEALTKSQELGSPSPAHDWLFLAMAERKLGNQDAARGWYDKADKWINENQKALEGAPGNAEELKRFRTEASELLGIKDE
jgi:tetratricopeptide (TPR) repeat protein